MIWIIFLVLYFLGVKISMGWIIFWWFMDKLFS